MHQQSAYEGGFADPPHQSAYAFRAAMQAMAEPGTIHTVEGGSAPNPLSPAAATLLLTLCDPDTSLHLAGPWQDEDVREWVAFHTGAPLEEPGLADFVVGGWGTLAPLSQYKVGVSEYPDRAATLIIECDSLLASGATLRGPGIKTTAQLNVPDIAAFQANRALYPLGVDCFFTAGNQIAALPRSTHVSLDQKVGAA